MHAWFSREVEPNVSSTSALSVVRLDDYADRTGSDVLALISQHFRAVIVEDPHRQFESPHLRH
jgi:hypothetical protein